MLTAATAMSANQAYDDAAEWLERAIKRDPLRIDGLLRRGFLALSASSSTPPKTTLDAHGKSFPELADVDWAFASLAEAEKDWITMLDECISAMTRAPDWTEAITGRLEATAETLYRASPDVSERILTRLRAALGDGYEHLFRNLLGNLRYAQADYVAAAECYRIALRLRPEEARYAANLALALEKAGTSDDEALDAAAAAHKRDPTREEYATLHARLLATAQFVRHYGPGARTARPDTHRITVWVPWSLLSQVATQEGALQATMQERLSALRQSLKQQYGFTLCGVNFRDVPRADDASGTLFIEIAGERRLEHPHAAADEDVAGVLDQAVRANIPLIFGHDEARTTAQSCDDAARLQNLALLNGFTHAVRLWLAIHGDLPDDALCKMVDAAEPLLPAVETPACGTVPTLRLLRSPNLTIAADDLVAIQTEVFNRCGVVIPLLRQEARLDLPPGMLLLTIDDAEYPLCWQNGGKARSVCSSRGPRICSSWSPWPMEWSSCGKPRQRWSQGGRMLVSPGAPARGVAAALEGGPLGPNLHVTLEQGNLPALGANPLVRTLPGFESRALI